MASRKSKSKFPKGNRIKRQVVRGLKQALADGYNYGKGRTAFHPPKAFLHSLSHPSRYNVDSSHKQWLKKA